MTRVYLTCYVVNIGSPAFPSQSQSASHSASRSATERSLPTRVAPPILLSSPVSPPPNSFVSQFILAVKKSNQKMLSNVFKLALAGTAAVMVNGQSTSTAPIGNGLQILSPGGPDVWWGTFMDVT